MTKAASWVLIGAVVGMLSGCFPYVTSYVYLDAPEVTHRRSPCRDGAPVGASYEKSGVRFEVALEPHGLSPLKEAYLKLRAPRSVAVSISSPIAHITLQGQAKPTSVRLAASSLDNQGPYVEEARRKSHLAEYRFVFVDLPPISSPGSLQLPAISVDGRSVESPIFTFERRSYAGVVPLNC